jgi:hypothetical protein
MVLFIITAVRTSNPTLNVFVCKRQHFIIGRDCTQVGGQRRPGVNSRTIYWGSVVEKRTNGLGSSLLMSDIPLLSMFPNLWFLCISSHTAVTNKLTTWQLCAGVGWVPKKFGGKTSLDNHYGNRCNSSARFVMKNSTASHIYIYIIENIPLCDNFSPKRPLTEKKLVHIQVTPLGEPHLGKLLILLLCAWVRVQANLFLP